MDALLLHLLGGILKCPMHVLVLVYKLFAFVYVLTLEEFVQVLFQIGQDFLDALLYPRCLFRCGLFDFFLKLENIHHELGILDGGLFIDVDTFEFHLRLNSMY